MKKLLSLLSVLTISGTAVPTTIASSGYEKEFTKLEDSKFNYLQTNNLENLNRNKRNNNELNIQLSNSLEFISRNRIIQQESMWCGPATGELALRILGLNYWGQTRVNNINYQQQLSLPNNMDTNQSTGTNPQNWVRAINNVINGHNLNNRRQYSMISWNRGYFNRNEFATLVRNSLENNVPVAIASTGRLPQYQGERNHFYLITGIREDNDLNSLSRYSYQYFDPADGDFRTIREGNMHTLFGIADIDYRRNMQNAENEFLRQGYSREELNRQGFIINNSNSPSNYLNYIISYNAGVQTETQIPSPNQTESMDFSGNNIGNIYSYFESCNSLLNNNRYIRSYLNNNQYCKNSTIYGNKINTFKILNRNRGNLNSGDAFIGTSNGFYILTKENNVLKKIDSVNGNIININLRTIALTVTNQNGTVYQVDYNKSGSSDNVSWLSGPAPTGWSFN